MVRLERVSMGYRAGGRRVDVLRDVTLAIPPQTSVALLGRNGAGKSTFLRLVSGQYRPASGRVARSGRASWPVGFSGALHPELTGSQNARFAARVHGIDSDRMVAWVGEFSGLGARMTRPVRGYSDGMRARLGFSMSMAIPFDLYLIDEVASVGDAAFRRKCEAALEARLGAAGAIIVSHNMGLLRRSCRAGLVLEAGQVRWFDDVEEAIAAHEANVGAGPA